MSLCWNYNLLSCVIILSLLWYWSFGIWTRCKGHYDESQRSHDY